MEQAQSQGPSDSASSDVRACAEITSHFAVGPQARWQGVSDEIWVRRPSHTVVYVWSEQRSQRACGPQPKGARRRFISISILRGKRKPGGISRETGKGAAENRPGRDWTGEMLHCADRASVQSLPGLFSANVPEDGTGGQTHSDRTSVPLDNRTSAAASELLKNLR
jgi:hypothetical protein